MSISVSLNPTCKLDIDCRVDHLTLTYIMKSKTEPAVQEIKDC